MSRLGEVLCSLCVYWMMSVSHGKTATIYADSIASCTQSLQLNMDGIELFGRQSGAISAQPVSDCTLRFRTRSKKSIYRIDISRVNIVDPKLYIVIYDGTDQSAGLLDFMRQGSQAPQQPIETTGNTVRIHISTDNPNAYIHATNFDFRAVISESSPSEKCRGFECYNQTFCVAWSLCNDGIDNCYDGSDETDECEGEPDLSAGAIVGIVVGSLAGVALIASFIFLIIKCYKKRSYSKDDTGAGLYRETKRDLSDPADTLVYEGPSENEAPITGIDGIPMTSNGYHHESFIPDEQPTQQRKQSQVSEHEEEARPNYHTTNFNKEQLKVREDPRDNIVPEPLSLVDG